ncbi:MAG: hypothetical protein N7Q72_07175, partial [Spiroplasma sp. Tabriz.8]|nr:hypothetical protein [Spiroplasma sp. Tabriz.8]
IIYLLLWKVERPNIIIFIYLCIYYYEDRASKYYNIYLFIYLFIYLLLWKAEPLNIMIYIYLLIYLYLFIVM